MWNSTGKVQIWNVTGALEKIESLDPAVRSVKMDSEKPLFSFDGHSSEGFALDWSRLTPGALASGDQHKKVGFVGWPSVFSDIPVEPGGRRQVGGEPAAVAGPRRLGGGRAVVADRGESARVRVRRPQHPPVGRARTRQPGLRVHGGGRARQRHQRGLLEPARPADRDRRRRRHAQGLVAEEHPGGWALAGADALQYGQAVARFKHHKSPITSVEWHPDDATTFMASGEDNQISFWDLAMETDTGAAEDVEGIPPQLLFLHMGLEEIKEVHWHPNITGLALATALNGFHAFRTVNI